MPPKEQEEGPTSVRLDKWLWAARFYKTRNQASTAISGGKVHVNGDRSKPSRSLKVGDTVRIRKGPNEWTVTVEQLSEKRGPAEVARTLGFGTATTGTGCASDSPAKAHEETAPRTREVLPSESGSEL